MLDLRTPSSPHFTLSQTTSATLSPQRSALVRRPPSLEAKCLTWPSLPVGAASIARGTSTATPTPNCAMPSLPLDFPSPGEVLEQVNETLLARIPSNMFVTCFYAILDP